MAGNTWRVAEDRRTADSRRRIPPILIVGIDHGELRRARGYLPVEDERNPFARRPLGREYAEFVTRRGDAIHRAQLSHRAGGCATGFGGSSYGAIAALYTALVKPGIFGRLLIESPSLYVGRGHLLRMARTAKRWPARVYLGVGTQETARPDWNELTVRNVLLLERALRRARLGPRRLRVRWRRARPTPSQRGRRACRRRWSFSLVEDHHRDTEILLLLLCGLCLCGEPTRFHPRRFFNHLLPWMLRSTRSSSSRSLNPASRASRMKSGLTPWMRNCTSRLALTLP